LVRSLFSGGPFAKVAFPFPVEPSFQFSVSLQPGHLSIIPRTLFTPPTFFFCGFISSPMGLSQSFFFWDPECSMAAPMFELPCSFSQGTSLTAKVSSGHPFSCEKLSFPQDPSRVSPLAALFFFVYIVSLIPLFFHEAASKIPRSGVNGESIVPSSFISPIVCFCQDACPSGP